MGKGGEGRRGKMTENIIRTGKGVILMLSLNLVESCYISFKNRKKQT